MFEISNSIKVANKVLAEVKKLAKKQAFAKSYSLETYCNGREQGWCLLGYGLEKKQTPVIAWAEHRCSDAIIVIAGHTTGGGNVPSPWNPVSFDPGDYKNAAKWIVGLMKN